jgi:hypothetical protein
VSQLSALQLQLQSFTTPYFSFSYSWKLQGKVDVVVKSSSRAFFDRNTPTCGYMGVDLFTGGRRTTRNGIDAIV